MFHIACFLLLIICQSEKQFLSTSCWGFHMGLFFFWLVQDSASTQCALPFRDDMLGRLGQNPLQNLGAKKGFQWVTSIPGCISSICPWVKKKTFRDCSFWEHFSLYIPKLFFGVSFQDPQPYEFLAEAFVGQVQPLPLEARAVASRTQNFWELSKGREGFEAKRSMYKFLSGQSPPMFLPGFVLFRTCK